ncbi:hypothetical protein FQZ97_957580 [compost metagenome]
MEAGQHQAFAPLGGGDCVAQRVQRARSQVGFSGGEVERDHAVFDHHAGVVGHHRGNGGGCGADGCIGGGWRVGNGRGHHSGCRGAAGATGFLDAEAHRQAHGQQHGRYQHRRDDAAFLIVILRRHGQTLPEKQWARENRHGSQPARAMTPKACATNPAF